MSYATASRLNIFIPSLTKKGVANVLENILPRKAMFPSPEKFKYNKFRLNCLHLHR